MAGYCLDPVPLASAVRKSKFFVDKKEENRGTETFYYAQTVLSLFDRIVVSSLRHINLVV